MTYDIQLVYNDKEYTIPNRWETISPEHYLQLTADLLRFSSGELSPGQVRINHLCRIMNWQKRRFRTEEQIANLVAISQQLTFLFQIDYLDNNDILDTLDAHSRNLCKHIPPHRLNIPMARVLQKLNYQYVVNLCFFAQLLPTVTIDNKVYHAYQLSSSYNALTCSLTALQYIEARSLLTQGEQALPLLAAILYFPGSVYNSQRAHALAEHLATLPPHVLAAISFNFQAVNTYLFTKTPFSLLAKFKPSKTALITTDAADAIYDLSKDGLGDAAQVEQINLITYLKLLRKKTIDAVHSLHGIGWDKTKISSEVALPIDIINQII